MKKTFDFNFLPDKNFREKGQKSRKSRNFWPSVPDFLSFILKRNPIRVLKTAGAGLNQSRTMAYDDHNNQIKLNLSSLNMV